MAKVLRTNDCHVLNPKCVICINTLSQSQRGEHYGGGGRKDVRARGWQEGWEMLSSGHSVAIVLLNLQQLLFLALDQASEINQHSSRQHSLNSVG